MDPEPGPRYAGTQLEKVVLSVLFLFSNSLLVCYIIRTLKLWSPENSQLYATS